MAAIKVSSPSAPARKPLAQFSPELNEIVNKHYLHGCFRNKIWEKGVEMMLGGKMGEFIERSGDIQVYQNIERNNGKAVVEMEFYRSRNPNGKRMRLDDAVFLGSVSHGRWLWAWAREEQLTPNGNYTAEKEAPVDFALKIKSLASNIEEFQHARWPVGDDIDGPKSGKAGHLMIGFLFGILSERIYNASRSATDKEMTVVCVPLDPGCYWVWLVPFLPTAPLASGGLYDKLVLCPNVCGGILLEAVENLQGWNVDLKALVRCLWQQFPERLSASGEKIGAAGFEVQEEKTQITVIFPEVDPTDLPQDQVRKIAKKKLKDAVPVDQLASATAEMQVHFSAGAIESITYEYRFKYADAADVKSKAPV